MSKVDKVLEQREEDYGDALENFETIGKVWGALLGINPIAPYQVALMMDSLKTVRLFKNANHEDSWLDKQGYIFHAMDIVTR
jgi:hypothetical protein